MFVVDICIHNIVLLLIISEKESGLGKYRDPVLKSIHIKTCMIFKRKLDF